MSPIYAGQSLYINLIEGPKPHLWFVLTDPSGNPPKVVSVMLRTAKSYTDPTLILNIGDHPFMSRPTCVDYSTAKLVSILILEEGISNALIEEYDDMSPNLLEVVQKSLLASPRTPNYIIDYCRDKF